MASGILSAMQESILVTGGAGFIGSHVCQMLSQNGFRPVVFDNLSRGHSKFVKWGPLVKNHLSETSRIIRTIKEYNIKSVMHFAAYAYVGESVAHPELYYENNVQGSLSLLKACLETQIENFIFSSSCATYGAPQKLPLTEDHSQHPLSPYGHTKLMTERMLQDFAAVSKMKFVGLRYFNAAGSSDNLEIGELHDPETHLIPNIILAALGKGPALKIFGNDYDTHDGTCLRDYIHVDDLARAHVKALTMLIGNQPLSPFYNLGAGRGYSVLEIIQKTEKLLGKKVPYEFAPRRDGDPAALFADTTKAQRELGFQTEKSIDEIILSAAKFLRAQFPESTTGHS